MFSAKQKSASSVEEVDEDLAVTQSQVNFICPLTQVLQTASLPLYNYSVCFISKHTTAHLCSRWKW